MKVKEIKSSIIVSVNNQFSAEEVAQSLCEDLHLPRKYLQKLKDKYNELLLFLYKKEITVESFGDSYVSYLKEIVKK